jgi:hypothetical protein
MVQERDILNVASSLGFTLNDEQIRDIVAHYSDLSDPTATWDLIVEQMIYELVSSRTPRVYRISTTAYEEEDFFISTTLSEEQIESTITPLVLAERMGSGEYYDNDQLVALLESRYPTHMVQMYVNFNTISI